MTGLKVGLRRACQLAALTAVLVAGIGTVASAATYTNYDGTLFGTSGSDTLGVLNANGDNIWGLGGSDTLTAGDGNGDTVDAGGYCQPGIVPLGGGEYPSGPNAANTYCAHGPTHPAGTDYITVGNGRGDTVYGNGGSNIITTGFGGDVVFAYGAAYNFVNVGDSTSSGDGGNLVFAFGPGYYAVGAGTAPSTVYDVYTPGDIIVCLSSNTTVYEPSPGFGDILGDCQINDTTLAHENAPSVPSLRLHRKTRRA